MTSMSRSTTTRRSAIIGSVAQAAAYSAGSSLLGREDVEVELACAGHRSAPTENHRDRLVLEDALLAVDIIGWSRSAGLQGRAESGGGTNLGMQES